MSKSVLVIGAGMAGIAAGRTLADAGYRVTILEARDRLGGRTHTDESLGFSADLGAAWIHGPWGNPMTAFAKKFKIKTGYTDFLNQSGTAILAYDQDGQPFPMAEYTEGLQLAAGLGQHILATKLDAHSADKFASLADYYHAIAPTLSLTPVQRQGFYYTTVIRAQFNDAADLPEIDWELSERYVKLPGGDLLLYEGGFGTMAHHLAEGLDIRLHERVKQIDYRHNHVAVTTANGQFSADAVIVTVPLGVLKAHAITFTPPLSAEKQGAIARIGYGQYEKLILQFDQFYWPPTVQRFQYASDERQLFTSWLNLGAYLGQPVIGVSHSGLRATLTNQWSDAEYVQRALELLRRLFGRSIPEPIAYLRTNWQNDPYALGSYSFGKVGQLSGDRRSLAAPVTNKLFFAGEATHSNYFATVHGAYESGIRAAKQLLALVD